MVRRSKLWNVYQYYVRQGYVIQTISMIDFDVRSEAALLSCYDLLFWKATLVCFSFCFYALWLYMCVCGWCKNLHLIGRGQDKNIRSTYKALITRSKLVSSNDSSHRCNGRLGFNYWCIKNLDVFATCVLFSERKANIHLCIPRHRGAFVLEAHHQKGKIMLLLQIGNHI